MRPACASAVRLRLLKTSLVLALLAVPLDARADAESHAAEARFLDASFERLLQELGLPPKYEQNFPGSSRLFCREMCQRFLEHGLTPSVDCSARCDRELPAPLGPSKADSSPESLHPAEPIEHVAPEQEIGAPNVIGPSRNHSREVTPAPASENSQP